LPTGVGLVKRDPWTKGESKAVEKVRGMLGVAGVAAATVLLLLVRGNKSHPLRRHSAGRNRRWRRSIVCRSDRAVVLARSLRQTILLLQRRFRPALCRLRGCDLLPRTFSTALLSPLVQGSRLTSPTPAERLAESRRLDSACSVEKVRGMLGVAGVAAATGGSGAGPVTSANNTSSPTPV
jgi:hypothetical protein